MLDAYLPERGPLLLPGLGQAVVVVTVRLEDVGSAQFVQGFERHT